MRKKTLIIAYHGFEVLDEAQFRPKLFIKGSTFKRRLQYLQKHCHVIKLDYLSNKNKPDNAVVITIDDGWASTLTIAAPLLTQFKFPYTIYLTTESVLAQQPIFHILLDYLLRKSLGKVLAVKLSDDKSIQATITLQNIPELISNIEQCKSRQHDTNLLKKVAANLGFSIDSLIDKKIFSLLFVEDVKALSQSGTDIQLHTHSHHNYIDDELVFNNEITINQDHIENITGIKPIHHCYPSGSFTSAYFDYLKPLGIKTATTCIPGFCDNSSNKFALPRFLDGENIPQIIFEAEVSGVLELLRKLKRLRAH